MLLAIDLLHIGVFFTFTALWVFLASFFVAVIRWVVRRDRADRSDGFGLGL